MAIGGRPAIALVDTGCSQTIVARKLLVEKRRRQRTPGRQASVAVVGGGVVRCPSSRVELEVSGTILTVDVLAMDRLVPAVDVLLGMDVINRLGGVSIADGQITFVQAVHAGGARVAPEQGAPKLSIDERDYKAVFDGHKWVVSWKWLNGEPELTNGIDSYAIQPELREKFDAEVKTWIREGWLKPVTDAAMGLIPLMAVSQAVKAKVRPVLDYRELNQFVKCHSADTSVCDETLRRWRCAKGTLKLLDLEKAYLQIHVDESLWKFQTIRFAGNLYCLTRLGFGLNCAPVIMAGILREVLSQDTRIKQATDSYLDDILVREEIASAEEVARHLERFGLKCKSPEPFDSSRVLGLQLIREKGKLLWRRGNLLEWPIDVTGMTRRRLFSLCGQLIGHFPVANWLRLACSWAKRTSAGANWDDPIGPTAEQILGEILDRLSRQDPVGGVWAPTHSEEATVWCDASSIATAVVLKSGSDVLEDAAWLRKKNDCAHINVAELEAVVKGLNLGLKWGFGRIKIMTDSATVYSWLQSILSGSHRPRTHGLSEMIVKRRLSLLSETVKEFQVEVEVRLVPSAENEADSLTRIPKTWLAAAPMAGAVAAASRTELEASHGQHHFGATRSVEVARQQLGDPVDEETMRDIIRTCEECQTIDPSSIRWTPGRLDVEETWQRVAIDTTHYGRHLYLTMCDCGPSRFALWHRIRSEDEAAIAERLEAVFCTHGPPAELLLDNSATFRSALVRKTCEEWRVQLRFRCAHRPSGNGIVERNHRTIKRIAARAQITPERAAFWYNVTRGDSGRRPSDLLFRHVWRLPGLPSTHRPPSPAQEGQPVEVENNAGEILAYHAGEEVEGDNTRARNENGSEAAEDGEEEPQSDERLDRNNLTNIPVGTQVFVRPPNARCTTRWRLGTVTRETDEDGRTLEVDGIPQHVNDVRSLEYRSPRLRQRTVPDEAYVS